jgi:1-acyl-sn-glycerol-3-phosphate acyltransferase
MPSLHKIRRFFVTVALKGILRALCRIDFSEYQEALFNNQGKKGLIIILNHINFLEVPMLVVFAKPGKVTGFVQKKAWKNPFMGFIFDSYDAIPLDRDGSYLHTFRRAVQLLDEGYTLGIAPEGHRSGTGILAEGKSGAVQLAWLSGAAILPLAHYGGQNFWKGLRHLHRTYFKFHAGKPFKFKFEGKPSRETQADMTREMMGQLARLLPEEMRGIYADEALKEPELLEFI